MKSFKNGIVLFLMCSLLVIQVMPNVAFASEQNTYDTGDDYEDPLEPYKNGTCGDNVNYHYDDNGTLTIYGTGPMEDYAFEPSHYEMRNEYIHIDLTMWELFDVKKVVIQPGVTKIGNGVFADSRITEISIPDTVTEIGCFAFYNCTKLQHITIPDTVVRIGGAAFMGTSLQELKIPDSVNDMGIYTCAKCMSLTSITLSEQLMEIPEGTCMNCAIESVVIPENVRYIGESAFFGCRNLTSIEIPKTVQGIDGWAFTSCDMVTIYGSGGSAAEEYAREYSIPFVPYESFKVIFKNEDGTILSEQTVSYGQDAVEPSAPVKKSDLYYTYEFVGWDKLFYEVKSDLVITAQYEAKEREYSIAFDANGGDISDAETLKVPYGTVLGTLPKCTKSGYTFRGWYTDPKQGQEVTAETEVTGDMVLYAHWHSVKPEKVKVTLKFKLGKWKPEISFKTYLGNVSGFEIQYSTSKDYSSEDTQCVSLKQSYQLSKILEGAVQGKTYFIRVRAISKEKDSTGNVVYGDWSESLKI